MKVIFKKMSLEENTNIISMCFNEKNNYLDIKKYTIKLFPELKKIDNKLSKKELDEKIKEIIGTEEYTQFKDTLIKITEELI